MRQLTPDQMREIDEARSDRQLTARFTSPGAEAVLYEMLPVLDQGFVRLIDYMGDDRSIPRAARMSYGRGTRKLSDDRALIRYLMRHRHTTPFEMPGVQLHVCLPIFVARQWMRHRTGTFNEHSARYSVMEREFYIPEPAQLAAQSTTNKQGRSKVLEGAEAARVLEILMEDAGRAYDHYLWMINEDAEGRPADPARDGLARELARMNLPVSVYTQFVWNVNLHNLLHFLKLRADPHAQHEIRVYAETIIEKILKPWVPVTFEAFNDFAIGSATLSRQGAALVNAALAAAARGERLSAAEFGVTGRELGETIAAFPALAALLDRPMA